MFNGAKNDYVNIDTILEQVLKNRGLKEPKKYIESINEGAEHSYTLLKNIDVAFKRFMQAIDGDEHIHIIVD